MQPTGSPPGGGLGIAYPSPVRRDLPSGIRLGLVLAGIGVVFTGVSWAWNYFGIRTIAFSSIAAFVQVEVLLAVAQSLSLQLGLFFIFTGILRILPSAGSWSRVGPILILAGGLVLAGVGLTEVALASSMYSPGSTGEAAWLYEGVLAASIIAYVATSLGLILSLFAVAKGVLLRTPPGAVLPPS